jgi:hypothetical protein
LILGDAIELEFFGLFHSVCILITKSYS